MEFQILKARNVWRVSSLVMLLVCTATGCRTIDDRLVTAETPREVAQAVADYYVLDACDESCAVAVVQPGGVAFACAGSASAHSLFRIASLSKIFLHPVLLKLHDGGRINLDRKSVV